MTETKSTTNNSLEKLARYFGALSNQRRISLLVEVASKTNCVKDNFVEVNGLNKFSVGMNLKFLKKYGFVNGTFTSKKLQYCVNYENLEEFKALFDEFYNAVLENKESVGLTDQSCTTTSNIKST